MTELQELISQDEIQRHIALISEQIDRHYAGQELTIVSVLKGSVCLVADLIRQLKTSCTLEFVKASSYGQRGAERGELLLTGLEEVDVQGRHLLVVDDIFDSGETLFQIISFLRQKNPKSLKSLVLLNKKVERRIAYNPDYVLFEIDNHFVVGYGLDYREHYRGLSGIYLLT